MRKIILLALVLMVIFGSSSNLQRTASAECCGNCCDGCCDDCCTGCCPSPSLNPSVSPSPSPCPSVSPNPSLSPSPNPSANPSPEPSSSPEPEVSPYPDPVLEIGLGVNGPTCTSNSFHTELKIKVDGVGQKDVVVKFSYKADEKTATTNSEGVAGADFEFKGNGEITSRADGYPNQTIGVEAPKDCPAGIGGPGEVLGATTVTTGRVLGASTMAGTGTLIEDIFLVMFTLGSGLTAAGLKLYVKKK